MRTHLAVLGLLTRENPFSSSWIVMCGQITDTVELTVSKMVF